MRIIAGEFRGRHLLPPVGDVTRPITDRVKQSLFDIICPWLEGAVVYDCFAGTGSMGLESLSRGASKAVFFEIDRSALGLLERNIASLGVKAASTVIRTDILKVFCGQAQLPPADVIFFDPPYAFLSQRGPDLQRLAGELSRNMNRGGKVIFRHDAADVLPLPPFQVQDARQYGQMTIEILVTG